MARWLQRSVQTVLACALCWGGAVWYWRSTNRMPATGDLALYLLVLPAGLLLAVWLGRRIVARATAAPAPVAASTAPEVTAAPPLPAVAPLAILDAALRLPHADSAEELASVLADARARPALDPELVDNNGFPAMTARAGTAVDHALQAAFLDWAREHGLHDTDPRDAEWRALTMATGVVADLAGPATAWIADDGTAPMLRLIPLLPTDWPVPLQLATAQWLLHTAVQSGWPAAHASVTGSTEGVPALLQRLAIAPSDTLTLLVACDSRLAQAHVDAWADNGTLFTAAAPQGLIPGEGAAGLLLAAPSPGHTLLHAVATDRRTQSADLSKRADATLLTALVTQVLERSRTDAASVALVVADSSQRVSRVLEVSGAIGSAVPHLDAGDDVLSTGAASGACGAVPLIAALALAHQQAKARGVPVLCLANDDPHDRCAALIGPAAVAS